MKQPGLDNRHRDHDGEIRRKNSNTLVRTLRKEFGDGFAKGYRVIEADAPRHLLLETETYDWLGRTDYTIEPDDGGAQVTVVSTMNVTGKLLRLQMLVVGRTLNAQRADALRVRTRALLTLAERMAAQP
ncbi:MAG TPA: hypothetical protein VFC54_03685 [Pseudolabrys sp.]|nr:hypothetical protein [Pseudolabrys sp.]